VKPPPFEFHAPDSVAEALNLLDQLGDEAKVLAGGQSLMPLLYLRLARPAHLVDINALTELSTIDANNGGLKLGAMVRQRAAERSDAVRQRNPLLAEALPLIGHPQIRNRGTIGGSLAHADPASELPAVAAALDAELVVQSEKRGQRTLKPDQFFLTFLTTAIEPDELLVEIRLPAWPAQAGWSYQEISRRHGDFALVGVAVLLRLANNQIQEARLAFTGAGAAPIRAHDAERQLHGQLASEETFRAAAEQAAQALDPMDDVHAPAQYRRHVAKVLARRALQQAAGRAQQGGVA
jgi:carbon-monoxide dehydrogenase medium subunit